MPEENDIQDNPQVKMSSQEHLQKKVIDFAFATCTRGCTKDEDVASYSSQKTGFVRSVSFLEPMVWKYIPDEVRNEIKGIHETLKGDITKILEKGLDDANVELNRKKLEDEAAIKILQYCLSALQYSSINTETKEIELFDGYEKLIKEIRTPTEIKLFSGTKT